MSTNEKTSKRKASNVTIAEFLSFYETEWENLVPKGAWIEEDVYEVHLEGGEIVTIASDDEASAGIPAELRKYPLTSKIKILGGYLCFEQRENELADHPHQWVIRKNALDGLGAVVKEFVKRRTKTTATVTVEVSPDMLERFTDFVENTLNGKVLQVLK